MTVEMQDGGLMLLGAGGDQEVRDRNTVAALLSELSMSSDGDRNRLGVYAQLTERGEERLDLLVLLRRTGAVEHLQAHDRAQANLSKLECAGRGPFQRGLVSKQQLAQFHAWSSLIASQSTVRRRPASAAR